MLARAGIFFEMYAGNFDSCQFSAGNDRIFVLRDLIAFRDIGIKIIFAVEFGEVGNIAIHREADFDDPLDGFLVGHGQSPRMRHACRTNIVVGALFIGIVLA